MRLFSYKMTHDTGFAPNPFMGLLTLATCKPQIRESKKKGDWIAGFASKKINGDEVGAERLIYLMRITDKITFAEYWERYPQKKQIKNLSDFRFRVGDNIYKPEFDLVKNELKYSQVENKHHNCSNIEKDLSSKNVLLSSHFYYFGAKPLSIQANIKPNIPIGQSAHGSLTKNLEIANNFISYIQNNYKIGIYEHPSKWYSNDETWKNDENYIKP